MNVVKKIRNTKVSTKKKGKKKKEILRTEKKKYMDWTVLNTDIYFSTTLLVLNI